MEPEWVSTDCLQADDSADVLATYEGMWITPGSPYRSMQGALNAIRHAREHSIPLIGSCGGFQHMVIEFARNRLGMPQRIMRKKTRMRRCCWSLR
ncbi:MULTISPECIES: hypothetical protein [unclassified Paenibacillus]|uniref:glutamine amidotransferase-related protein n=1 Tax=unclassified Paenibacillus TaxID=185978 RepID=UPI001F1210DF|nr:MULTISPECIES: hypothetical protein [unclassified Paenibacillus]